MADPLEHKSTTESPKALNLVWRALSDCLPTLTQLQQKRVHVNNICPVCQQEVESILQSLVTCQHAHQSWLLLLPGITYPVATCFKSWLSSVFNTVDSRKHAEVITLCWSIWRSRNDLIWNQKTTSINRIVATARQYLVQWKITQCRSFSTPLQHVLQGDGTTTWVKPQPNKIKVYVDAAVFEDREDVGFGIVARDCKGDLIEAKAVFSPGLVAPFMAEALAFKEALSWMEARGWHGATVESDCLGVVQTVRSQVDMRSYYGSIIEECRRMLKRLNSVSLFFVKRSANMVAHQLARESYYLSGRIIDRSSVSSSIQHCIPMDLIT